MNKKITLYILTYNRPDYLEQCLVSLKAQTFKNFKTIILDNCSDKNLEFIISKYPELNIEYIRHEKNLGSTGNLIFAWNHPKNTEYFVLFHDDDIMHPTFLERELEILELNKDVEWVANSSINFIGEPPKFKNIQEIHSISYSKSELAIGLIKGLDLTFSSVMYRSKLGQKLNISRLVDSHSIIFDRPLLFELIREGKCALIKEPLILYRCHENQDSKTGPLNEDNLFALFMSYKDQLNSSWTNKTKKLYYSWTAFQVVDGYKRIDIKKKSPFKEYIKTAEMMGIYKDKFYILYLLGYLIYIKNRFVNLFLKVFR